MRVAGPVCLALLLALSACHKPAKETAKVEPAAPIVARTTGFAHDPGFDPAGFYRPQSVVKSGNFQLNQIAMGALSDFSEWEAGKREGLFGPIIIQFDDVTSPTATNDQGAPAHTVTVKLLPAAYKLYPGEAKFSANDATLGAITFDGKYDQATFADAHKTGASADLVVLSGELKIGTIVVPDVKFSFWPGD